MKAIDWIPVFQKDFETAMTAYVMETAKLIETRKCKTTGGIEAAIREQLQKFRSIAARVYPEHQQEYVSIFEDVLATSLPTAWAHYEVVQAQQYIARQKRVISARYKQQMEEAKAETDSSMRLAIVLCAVLDRIDSNRELRELIR
jgi:hypothetical protein